MVMMYLQDGQDGVLSIYIDISTNALARLCIGVTRGPKTLPALTRAKLRMKWWPPLRRFHHAGCVCVGGSWFLGGLNWSLSALRVYTVLLITEFRCGNQLAFKCKCNLRW